ncbi:MAG: hypothetical protein QM661_06935 [Solimonas sp.]
MVIFDATFLMLLADPNARLPTDPGTGQPVTNGKERITHLLSELQKSGERVGIPTPALAEVLIGAKGSITDLVAELTAGYKLKTLQFDELAAIEVALITDRIKVNGISDETKAKVKYDRQIIAIAKVVSADAIYSDDIGLRKKAQAVGLRAIGLEEVPLPPEEAQRKLALPEPPEAETDDGKD